MNGKTNQIIVYCEDLICLDVFDMLSAHEGYGFTRIKGYIAGDGFVPTETMPYPRIDLQQALSSQDNTLVLIAASDAKDRQRVAALLVRHGLILAPAVISAEAHVAKGAKIGRGSIIFPFSYVSASAQIGEGVMMMPGSSVGTSVSIEPFSTVCR